MLAQTLHHTYTHSYSATRTHAHINLHTHIHTDTQTRKHTHGGKRWRLLACGSRARADRNQIRYKENLKRREEKQKTMEVYGKLFLPVARLAPVHLSSSTPDNRRHFMLGSRTVRASTRQTVFHRIRGRHTVRDLRRRQRRNDDYDEDDEFSFTHRQKIFQSSLPPRHRCHNQHSVALKSCCFKEPNNVRGPPRVYTHLPNNNRGFFHLFYFAFFFTIYFY